MSFLLPEERVEGIFRFETRMDRYKAAFSCHRNMWRASHLQICNADGRIYLKESNDVIMRQPYHYKLVPRLQVLVDWVLILQIREQV